MTSPLPSLSFCLIDDTALFLDLVSDRYFRLSEPSNAAFVAQLEDGVATSCTFQAAGLERFSGQAPLPAQRPGSQARESVDLRSSGFSPLLVSRALWEQRVAKRHLRNQGLHAMLADLRETLRGSPIARLPLDARATRIAKAFEDARLVHSAVDQCLPRSIALAHLLAAVGSRCEVILGAKLRPFAAHCWVQSGSVVLNESVEETARYTPILVL